MSRYILLALLITFAISLQACEPQPVEDDAFGVPEGVTDPEEVDEHLESICAQEGGEWREFPNTCVDSCDAARDEYAVCGQALTYGCDCGDGMCWDGQTCVEI